MPWPTRPALQAEACRVAGALDHGEAVQVTLVVAAMLAPGKAVVSAAVMPGQAVVVPSLLRRYGGV